MERRTLGVLTVAVLILFCIGVLFVGQEYSSNSKLVSVRIGGVIDEQSDKHVQELMKMVNGIETIILDQNARLCTFRYDSSITNYQTIEAQFMALGLTITPITPVDTQTTRKKPNDQKLIRIHFSKNS